MRLHQILVSWNRLLAPALEFGQGRQIHTSREMIANRVQEPDSKIGIVIEARVCIRKLAEHDGGDSIAFGRAVDSNQQDIVENLCIDTTFRRCDGVFRDHDDSVGVG